MQKKDPTPKPKNTRVKKSPNPGHAAPIPLSAEQQLAQREAELAIINSVQEGLASKLNMQAIYELVGEKIRETFNAEVIDIVTYDTVGNLLTNPYSYEKGDRTNFEPREPYGFRLHVIQTRKSLLLEGDVEKLGALYNNPIVIGEMPKTALFVPILLGDSVKGVISLQDLEKENAYNQSDVRLLETLANSMSVALENARLFAQTEQRNAGLAIINSLQEGLASKLDLQAIYDLVGNKLQEIFDAQVVDIGLLDRSDNMIHFPYTIERGVRFPDEPLPVMGFRKHVMETRQPLLINTDVPGMSAKFGNPLTVQGEVPKSDLFLPMIVDNQAVGVISLQNLDKENAFTESEVDLLTTLVNSMSVALENARLFAETEERNAELAIINSVQEGLASKLDIVAIYELVGDRIREVFNAQVIDIVAYDKQKNLIKDLYSYEKGDRSTLPERAPKGYRLHVINTKKTLVINKDLEKRRAEFGQMSQSSGAPAKSVVFTPVISGEEVTGIISIQNLEEENAFTETSIRLLETLANSMSVALENARLFSETQRLLKETEERNAEMAVINSVQQGLAAELDFQTIIDLVGGKISEIFNAQVTMISLYLPDTKEVNHRYLIERGERIYIKKPVPIDRFRRRVVETRQPWLINKDYVQIAQEIGEETVLEGEEPKSLLFAPMIVANEVTGIISLQNLDIENAFSESDVRLLSTIAASMSVTLENARLFNAEQQRVAELAALSKVTQALVAESELESTIQLIGNQMREIFDADIAYLALLDAPAGLINFHYQYGEEFPQRKLGEGLTSRILLTGEPLLINRDVVEQSISIGAAAVGKEALSYLGVPVKAGGETIGVISVQSTTREGIFNEDSLRLLNTIAASAGAAIHNAQLHDETRRRERETSALLDISRDISSSLDLNEVLEGITRHAKDLLNGDLGALFLPDDDGITFRAITAIGEDADELRNDTTILGEGLLGDIARTKVGEIINYTSSDSRTVQIKGTVEEEAEHLLAVPLLANDELKGLMAIWRTGKGKEFVEAELKFLSGLSRQAVIAVQNAQLFSEAEELRVAAEQANTAKSAFLANMSHELRTPLNAIIGFTRIVRRKADGALPEKQIENLDKVISSSEHLLGLINTVLDIAKIEAGRMDVYPIKFEPAELAEQCVTISSTLLKPQVTLEKIVEENLPAMFSDEDKIRQIVLNLLSNAAKFTHKGKVVLSMEKADKFINIHVKDSGIGISEKALGKVFEEFQQADTSTTRQYGGTGLGLAISRNLARLLGGDLTATSELGKGSTFILTLPIEYQPKTVQPIPEPGTH